MQLYVAGRSVKDPMKMWRAYAQGFSATLRGYDFQPVGESNALTAEEAYRSRKINSRITKAQSEYLEQRALNAPWTDVPSGADLENADPEVADGLFRKMTNLYWHFTWPRTRGVGVAKVHKALHPKRPALYPILDQRVKRLYRPLAVGWLQRLTLLESVTTMDSPPYWAAIRDDLLRDHEILEHYRVQFADHQDYMIRSMAKLSRVRLLDIVAWRLAE
jgi:Family of unknown function (DUF6308)